MTAYCDTDCAEYVESRKSVTWYCIKFGNSLISWKVKKQNIVSIFSVESEYRSMETTLSEIMASQVTNWIKDSTNRAHKFILL